MKPNRSKTKRASHLSVASRVNRGLRSTQRVTAKLTAALTSTQLLQASHEVTGHANGKLVASERGDRRQCERVAREWRGSGLVVEVREAK